MAQRLETDLRSRQIEPALHGQLGPGLQQAREHLGQEPVLGEVLRTNDDGFVAGCRPGQADDREQHQTEAVQLSISPVMVSNDLT